MLETAAWADHAGGASLVGRGACRRRNALYAMAEVEELEELWRAAMAGREVAAAGLSLEAAARHCDSRMLRGAMLSINPEVVSEKNRYMALQGNGAARSIELCGRQLSVVWC